MDKLQQYLHRIRKLLNLAFFRILFFLVLAFVLYASLFTNVKPEKFDLSLFTVADKTIRSPSTVEDKYSTEKKRNEAMEQVQDVYILKKEYTQNRVALITSIFDSALEVNAETVKNKQAEDSGTESTEKTGAAATNAKITKLKAKLTEKVTKDLSNDVLSALIQADANELSNAKDLTVTAINNVMAKRISADEVENAKKRVEEELKYSTLSSNLKRSAIELGRYAIVQNEFYDPQATEELRQQAAESVKPVKILQGQIIVEEGKLIDREIYRQLKLVGLLNNSQSFKPFIGLAIFILIFMTSIYWYFYQKRQDEEKDSAEILLFGLTFLISIFIMKILSLLQIFDYSGMDYLFPAAMSAMLLKILIDEKVAILTSIVTAVCGSVLFNDGISGTMNFSAGVYILFSSLAGILFLTNKNHRTKILQAGIFVSLVNLLTIWGLLFLSNGQNSGLGYVYDFAGAVGSGIGSSVLTIGLLPFFEGSFGFLTTMKLIELSNPNHPLLRKILTEAPGTYHHSVMVANLAESACEAIGVNGLLARVGSYYHDVGKTKRPNFFIENQMNHENPHDRLSPETSKDIIIAHVADGVKVLKEYRMPREIIDIAQQHHGTTLLKYFYHKLRQAGKEVNEGDFRYPGPKAQSKEAAVVGIADSVEAAVRSLTQPTPEQIAALVKKIIVDRLQDGQLNECDLTLKELEIVSETLCETVTGFFHSRIEYPEMTKQQKVKEA